MKYTKEILVSDYFNIHDFYSKIYGNGRTIIIMQVGSFHECYCTDTNGLNLVEIAQKLDVVCTRKNSKEPVSLKNPRMLGFPTSVTDTFIEKLCNINFTVIKIDQTTEPPKPKREVVGIFSPGTLIEKQLNNFNCNYIVSIVIDKIKDGLCIGLASYDLSTGYGSFYETYSKDNYIISCLDDTNRYLETCPPKEIILHNTILETDIINNMSLNDILRYLNIEDKMRFSYENTKNTSKLSYQKVIFDKVFPKQINIFDILNLHLYNWARHALTNIYDYAQNHQVNLINKLKLPLEFENKKYLYLGNHPLDQLNIFNKNTEKSLYQIINNTKTILGKRFLIDSLSKPIIDIDELNNRYNLIDNIINEKTEKLGSLLEDISDIERLVRRVELGIMHPYELYLLYISLYQINKLAEFCNYNNLFDIDNDFNVNSIIDYITSTFNLNLINSINFTNFDEYDNNIFNPSKYPDLDELLEDINSSKSFMDNLINTLSTLIDDKKIFSKKKDDDNNMLTMKFNERDGHYLHITNRRCEILKKALLTKKIIEIGKIKLNSSDLEFSELPKSSYTKISCKKIKEISNELVIQQKKMAKLIKTIFLSELIYISNNFNNILLYWGKKIGYIDFINSGAITAIKYHYSKPSIEKTDDSYFNSINMRHPIVEVISKDYEYKPHDISLGGINNISGMLLYGINSSGKSTLMKSIGLNIILAQIGYFVACDKFIFSPYHALFTRIHSNDNIYKGLSSFMVELIELSSILKRNNANTLVIADEVCKGSEHKSSIIMVAYMLKTLCESKTSFITASHLHELVDLPTVKSLNNLKINHIKLSYDESNDKLIYDRILSDGSGPNFYGLQVAKYLMKDTKFNDTTTQILDEYNNFSIKQSKYNSEILLIECHICKNKNNLETHHIVFQKDFDNKKINKNKFHLQKNSNYNLVTLCQNCHDEVDRQKIIINGWIETSNGRILDYICKNTIIKKQKHDNELINYIKSLKLETNDPKFARIKIKECFNKKVSSESIINYWK
jgi:DNA mismatch repair protein MutS